MTQDFCIEYSGPDDVLHWTGRLQNWNDMCAECHSPNLVMGYDAETKSYNTTMQAVFGQFYIAILVAGRVGAYISDRQR